MVECIDIGSYIITVVVMMHGQVIKLNISSPEKQKIFENVTLLSLAGDFSEVGLGDNAVRDSHLNTLNEMFQQNLNKETITVMQTAADRIRPAYSNYMKMFFGQSAENSCKIFDNIQFDKAFGTGIEGIFARMIQCILPDMIGIYVISVHKKIDTNTLDLFYPKDKSRPKLNLLERADLIQFAKIFTIDRELIIPPLISPSSGIILLSDLIRIIKDLVGRDKCKLNIIDYSCSNLASSIPEAELPNAIYMQPRNIENAKQSFGGKNARKKRPTHRRFAKKRYTKKRHVKNKSSNNPIQKKQHKNT